MLLEKRAMDVQHDLADTRGRSAYKCIYIYIYIMYIYIYIMYIYICKYTTCIAISLSYSLNVFQQLVYPIALNHLIHFYINFTILQLSCIFNYSV